MTVTKAVANQSAPANESLSPDEGKDDGKICPDTNEIKRLRKQNGISQETLAYKTGLSLKTIRNLESNPNYRCRASTLSVLADFYGIEAKAFVIRDDKKITLLTNTNDIIAANINICRSAEKIFACMGSRSRDVAYLEEVEKKL